MHSSTEGGCKMIYDTYDYDFLRLCGLCKYVPKELYKRYRSDIFCRNIVENLMYHKIIKLQNNKLSYKLTTKGKEVLAEMGDTFPEDVKMNINRVAYKRMLISARFTVLLHLAGINVFCRNIEQLNKEESGYICKHMLYEKYERRKIAGTRFLGILKLHDVIYIPYYVESSNDGILPKFEKSVFSKIVSDLDGVKKIIIMLVGETLEELCDNFFEEHKCENSNRGYRSFKRALEILGEKFSFVSLDRCGVLQLNIMNIWRYKRELMKAINNLDQNPGEYTLSDGIYKECTPLSIGLDISPLEIKAAVKQAWDISREHRPRIVYLWFQHKVWLRIFEREINYASILSQINEENMKLVFGKQLKTFERKPFFKDGKCIAVHPPDDDKEEDVFEEAE